MSFPQPPNRTNHNAHYAPVQDLFTAAGEGNILVQKEDSLKESEPLSNANEPRWKFCDKTVNVSLKGYGGNSILASVLLRKLRWSTLGLQFDWSKVIHTIQFS